MGLFGGSTTTEIMPGKIVRDEVQDVLDSLNAGYEEVGPYRGDFYAGTNQLQDAGLQAILDQSLGYNDLADVYANLGNQLTPGLGMSYDIYSDLAGGGPLSQDPSKYYDIASMLPDNYAQDMINSGIQDIDQQYAWQTMPSISGAFANTSDTNNTKFAQMNTLQKSLRDQDVFRLGSGIRMDMFNRGLDFAGLAANQDMQGMLTAASGLRDLGTYGVGLQGMAQDTRMIPGQTQMAMGDWRQQQDNIALQNQYMKHYEPLNYVDRKSTSYMPWAQLYTKTKNTSSPSTVASVANIAARVGAAYLTGGMSEAAGLGGQMGNLFSQQAPVGGGGGGGGVPITGNTGPKGSGNITTNFPDLTQGLF